MEVRSGVFRLYWENIVRVRTPERQAERARKAVHDLRRQDEDRESERTQRTYRRRVARREFSGSDPPWPAGCSSQCLRTPAKAPGGQPRCAEESQGPPSGWPPRLLGTMAQSRFEALQEPNASRCFQPRLRGLA